MINGEDVMERESDMLFSEFIRQRRKILGLTQEEFANRLHVSKSAVAKWEAGRGIPGRTNLRVLSEVTGVSIYMINRICEGCEQDISDALIVKEIIAVLEANGYMVTRRTEG